MTTGQLTADRWAEVEELWAKDGLIRLAGSLQGPDPPAGRWRLHLVPAHPAPTTPRAWLSLRLRRRRTARRRGPGPYDVTVSAGRFDVAVPVRDLTPPRPFRSERWDVRLVCHTVRTEVEMPVGRRLGRPRARAITYPAQCFTDGRGARYRVRPRYTADDRLLLVSRRVR